MSAPLPSVPNQTNDWIDIGEPSAAVEAVQTARMRRILPFASIGGGLIFGGIAGFAATTLWAGVGTWSIVQQVELFIAVAGPVGIAEFFLNRWMVPWLAARARLQVRRISVFDGKLHIEQLARKPIVVPLKRVRVSDKPTADDWFSVSLLGGQFSPYFFVPNLAASRLKSAIAAR